MGDPQNCDQPAVLYGIANSVVVQMADLWCDPALRCKAQIEELYPGAQATQTANRDRAIALYGLFGGSEIEAAGMGITDEAPIGEPFCPHPMRSSSTRRRANVKPAASTEEAPR